MGLNTVDTALGRAGRAAVKVSRDNDQFSLDMCASLRFGRGPSVPGAYVCLFWGAGLPYIRH